LKYSAFVFNAACCQESRAKQLICIFRLPYVSLIRKRYDMPVQHIQVKLNIIELIGELMYKMHASSIFVFTGKIK